MIDLIVLIVSYLMLLVASWNFGQILVFVVRVERRKLDKEFEEMLGGD